MKSFEIGSRYEGPVRESSIRVAGRSIKLVQPIEPDLLLDDPEVLARNAFDDYMPYWAYLWPGAFLLAEAVAAEPWVPGTAALEIGCGLGLAGLMGRARGLRVTFTDYDDAPLGFVSRSALASGHAPSSYSTRRLEWREPPAEPFPVILGADVLYERRLVPLVAGVLSAMLAPGGLALIADPFRAAALGFAGIVESHGLTCESLAVEAQSEELGPLRGTLHRVSRPIGR